MSLTPTASTTNGNAVKSPDAVVSVSAAGTAASSGNIFTTSNPKILYTAPSNCQYTKIYFNKSVRKENTSYIDSSTSTNYFYALEILNGTVARELVRGGDNTTLTFNHMHYTNSYAGSPLLVENDVLLNIESVVNGVNYISGKNFTLGPGESLQLKTFNNTNNESYLFNFQAWVYNT